MPDGIRDSEMLADAFEFAGQVHARERRKADGSPFIGHPVTVARLLDEARQPDEVIVAALLHDVVENAGVRRSEIEARFGRDVADLVEALSEDAEIAEYEPRKNALRAQVEGAGQRAAAIYAADKLSNLRDMRAAFERDGEAAAERFPAPIGVRIELWRNDLAMVERIAPRLSFLRDLRYELEAFEEERAQEHGRAA